MAAPEAHAVKISMRIDLFSVDAEGCIARGKATEASYTIADFNREFPDDDACLEYIKEQRWPRGVTNCRKCGVERKHHRVTGRTSYVCNHCGNHIYPLAGTVFAKSRTSLKTWFYVMHLMGATRQGLSAKRIQRETGVTYKTAWRTLRQLRLLLPRDGQGLPQSLAPGAGLNHKVHGEMNGEGPAKNSKKN